MERTDSDVDDDDAAMQSICPTNTHSCQTWATTCAFHWYNILDSFQWRCHCFPNMSCIFTCPVNLCNFVNICISCTFSVKVCSGVKFSVKLVSNTGSYHITVLLLYFTGTVLSAMNLVVISTQCLSKITCIQISSFYNNSSVFCHALV